MDPMWGRYTAYGDGLYTYTCLNFFLVVDVEFDLLTTYWVVVTWCVLHIQEWALGLSIYLLITA